MKRALWILLQIALFIIGTVATYNYRPDSEARFVLAPLAGFCFAYWVTWAISKLMDAPLNARRLLYRVRSFWR